MKGAPVRAGVERPGLYPYNGIMTRLAVIALLLAIIVVLFRAFFRGGAPGAAATEMVQDPNCQTFIPKPEAFRQSVEGRELYFCSRRCADEYRLKSGGGGPAS